MDPSPITISPKMIQVALIKKNPERIDPNLSIISCLAFHTEDGNYRINGLFLTCEKIINLFHQAIDSLVNTRYILPG